MFQKLKEKPIWAEISLNLRSEISDLVTLYFRRYDLRYLGFLQAPEFHLKQVIMEFSL